MRRYLQHGICILVCLALLGSEVMAGVAAVSSANNKENCDSICAENEAPVSKPKVDDDANSETPTCCRTKKEIAVSEEILKLMEYVEFAQEGTCRNCPCCIPTSPFPNDLPKPLPVNNESVKQILQQAETISPSISLSDRFSKMATRESTTSPAIPLTDSALLCVWLT